MEIDIIEKVKGISRWIPPIVPIIKSDSTLHICVDMRRGNEAIIKETYPFPTIEDVRYKIRKSNLFTKLDIRKVFHQIELSPEIREILKRLRIAQATGINWKEKLLRFLTMYRNTPHSITEITPSEALFNRKVKDKLLQIEGRINDKEMRDLDKIKKFKGKEYSDNKRGVISYYIL